MTAGMVVFWVLLIAPAVLSVRALRRPVESSPEPRPSPERLLAERFARGEIDEEEYRQWLATLTGAPHVSSTP